MSGAALAYEILLTRLFSISQWHHFAHMAISLALLGFGASGTFLVMMRARLLRVFGLAYATNLALFGSSSLICFALAQRIAFNPEELLWDPVQWRGLVLIYVLLALPFFFAANGLGLALMVYKTRVARVYAADLIGAGLGGAATIGLLYLLIPSDALRVLALAGVLSAVLAWVELRLRPRLGALVLAVLALAVWSLPAWWSLPVVSPYKALSQTMRVAGTRIVGVRSSPLGLLQVVQSELIPLRHAPGLSLNATLEPPEQVGVFTDADSMTVITRWSGEAEGLSYLEYLTSALPFEISDPRHVLVLGAGGGTEVLQALRYGAPRVDAVELNPQMVDLVRRDYGAFSGDLYDSEQVRVHASEAREYIASSESAAAYDLIELSLTDSFAASSAGLYALTEGYLYTVEALQAYLRRLAPEGYLAITRWLKLPPKDTLKMFATAVEALQASGAADPGRHLILIRGLQTSTLLVKRSPIESSEITRVREFCAQRSFDLAWYPDMAGAEANRYNVLQRPYFHEGARALVGEDRAAFYERYKYDVRPATDDRPYFFHFFKWSTLPEMLALRGRGGTPLIDAGYVVLVATLGQALAAGLVFILVPLAFIRNPRSGGRTRVSVLAYFFLIGLAFLFLEIAFIQKFILFLHHPVYAIAVVLTAFLFFAGLGSALSERLAARFGPRRTVVWAVALIAALGLMYLLWLDPLFASLLAAPVAVRIAVTVALISPLALCMGMPFPQALNRLYAADESLVPWAWGINGCASVVSAVLAMLLAIHFGFTVVTVSALLLYGLAAAAFPRT